MDDKITVEKAIKEHLDRYESQGWDLPIHEARGLISGLLKELQQLRAEREGLENSQYCTEMVLEDIAEDLENKKEIGRIRFKVINHLLWLRSKSKLTDSAKSIKEK